MDIAWFTFITGHHSSVSFFKQVPNITSFHNFKAAHDFYGKIHLKEYFDSSEQWLPILKTGICLIDLDTMPTGRTIPGLDLKQQWYLFEQIRPHCKTNLPKDLTCPRPSAPKNSVIPHNFDEVGDNQPCKKRGIVTCGVCKLQGHTKRVHAQVTVYVEINRKYFFFNHKLYNYVQYETFTIYFIIAQFLCTK